MIGFEVIYAMDGVRGIELIEEHNIDLILLDIMLPKKSGYELMPIISKKNIPVICVTAKDKLSDKIKGFELGADDYLTKPFEPIELIARVKAVLKRTGRTDDIIGFDDIKIHTKQHKVFKGDYELELTPKEYELLHTLLEHKSIALTRQQLLEMIWGYEFEGNTRTVDMHVQKLRTKLNTDKIKTVYKIGYRLEA